VGQERQVAAGDEDEMIEFGCFSIYTHNRCNDDNRDAQPMKLSSTMSNRLSMIMHSTLSIATVTWMHIFCMIFQSAFNDSDQSKQKSTSDPSTFLF
jgi:hypothetical protein